MPHAVLTCMVEEPETLIERRGRTAMIAAMIGVGALAVGSCGGMALGHYTVAGMMPLGDAPPAYAEQVPDGEDDWFRDTPPVLDVKVEGTGTEAGTQPPA